MNVRPLLCAALTCVSAFGRLNAERRTISDAEVMNVHRSALLIDTHNDVTSETVDGMDVGVANSDTQTDLPRLRQGGVGATFFAAFVDASYMEGNRSAHRALDMIDTIRHDIVDRHPKDFFLATSADDIRRAHKEGKIAALIGIEGGHAIEDDVRLLRSFYALGVRYMTLTHMKDIAWAGSSGSKENRGLTQLGREVVAEMNRLGMMVDISHVSDKTFKDVLEASSAPVFASHSSCRAISPAARNMTDEMISAMAKKGGVIQINLDCGYLNPEIQKVNEVRMKELMPKYEALRKKYENDPKGLKDALREWRKSIPSGPRATIADVVKHIDHVVKVAGIDAVGLGSDFDGVFCLPEGLDSVDKWPNLTRALLESGYTAPQIRKVYGENLLRYMSAVESTARKLQASRPASASGM